VLFTLIALGLGLVIALATGGRFHHLSGRTFRLWLLLPVAIGLQFGLEADGVPAPFALLVTTYVLLLAFGLCNLKHRGMWMVVLGFALNAVVITANHGMPVRPSALSAIKFRGDIHEVKRHRQKSSDKLVVLGDIIPVPPLDTILSFGDMILALGVINLLFNVMRPTGGGHGIDPTTRAPSKPAEAGEAADAGDAAEAAPLEQDHNDPFGLDRLIPQS
jgi:hypothetical protein